MIGYRYSDNVAQLSISQSPKAGSALTAYCSYTIPLYVSKKRR